MNENRPLDEGINMTELLQPSINDQSSPMTTTIDSGQGAWRDLALLVISIIGLVGNAIMIILFITVRRFRKPKNSFFIHHCTLDVVKSSFCIIFSRVSQISPTYLPIYLLTSICHQLFLLQPCIHTPSSTATYSEHMRMQPELHTQHTYYIISHEDHALIRTQTTICKHTTLYTRTTLCTHTTPSTHHI